MADLTEKERKQILIKVLDKLDLAYGKNIGEDVDKVRLWYHQIGHLNEEAALATADACISHHKWQPTISEFLEISRSVRRHQEEMLQSNREVLSEHVKALQEKGLLVQRALIKARAMPNRRHDHSQGGEACPICIQACSEEDSDECRTCFILENNGLPAVHHRA